MEVDKNSSNLNEQQIKAVNCSLGNKLILAGAGSGKTRVLIHRVERLILDFKIQPGNILALTFTNKASNEMKQRLEKVLRMSSQGLWFGTFHGICRRILKIHWKEAGIKDFFSILDSQDQLRIIKRIIKQKNLDQNLYEPKHLQSFINTQKDKGLRYDKCDYDDNIYIEIFKDYDLACRQTNSVDFADLILLTYEMLLKNKKILHYYSSRFKNIMVDEFQDTNALQFELLKLLNGKDGSLYAVGDDDQAIYGWRGARSKNIKYFTDEFSNVEVFKLEQNYRSTNSILSVANELISNKSNYRTILLDIWGSMPTSKILQNTTMNIKLGNHNTKGYKYDDDLKFSFQSKDAQGTFKEICKMVSLCKYTLDIQIELGNGDDIGYKI